MRHLKENQFLDWVESGRADAAAREHVKQCAACAGQLNELRETFALMTANDPGRDMEPFKEIQFQEDLRRKIGDLPDLSPLRGAWESLERTFSAHFGTIGLVVTALVVFAVVAVFKYDKMTPHGTTGVAVNSTVTVNPVEAKKTAMAVTDEMAAVPNLDPSDLMAASVAAVGNQSDDVEVSIAGEFSHDPFHSIDHLTLEQVARLKVMLKQEIKGSS